ncbi:MAG TPA: copper amine oxidase, partial [Clostridiales bacterium]|nr:copper amine oxidase [Clostridiales bacterium]
GKTMVPLRFLSENMGYDVDWDADSRTAIVNS